MSEPFLPGDLVQRKLPTDGPVMTVEAAFADDQVRCLWHDAKGHMQSVLIDARYLEHVQPTPAEVKDEPEEWLPIKDDPKSEANDEPSKEDDKA